MVRCTLTSKSDGLTVSLGGCDAFFQHSCKSDHVITSFNSHSHFGDDKPRWRYKDVLQVHLCSQLYCPQECRGELISFMSGICQLGRCFSCLKIFLILESNLTFQRSCLFKYDCWNEIREMLIFKSILEIKLYWSKIQHALFNVVLCLSCTFERKEIDSL